MTETKTERWAPTQVSRWTWNPKRYRGTGQGRNLLLAEYADATVRQLDHNHNFPNDIFELHAVVEPGVLDEEGEQKLLRVRMIGGRTTVFSDGSIKVEGFVETTRDGTPLEETEHLASDVFRYEEWWQKIADEGDPE